MPMLEVCAMTATPYLKELRSNYITESCEEQT